MFELENETETKTEIIVAHTEYRNIVYGYVVP